MSGDNKSVVNSASIPASTLSKKSTLASYHQVREAIAAGYLSSIQLERWKIQPYRHPQQTLGIYKYLATLETSTFLEGETNELTAKIKGSDRISAKNMGSILNPNRPRIDP